MNTRCRILLGLISLTACLVCASLGGRGISASATAAQKEQPDAESRPVAPEEAQSFNYGITLELERHGRFAQAEPLLLRALEGARITGGDSRSMLGHEYI